MGTSYLILLIQRTGFPQSARNSTVQFHTNSHTQTHTDTHVLAQCYSSEIYHRHFLNNCGLPGIARELYRLLFRTDKGRRRKRDPVIPGACLLFLAGISFRNGSGPKNIIHCAPLRLLGLILEASLSGGRRKGEGEGWETGGHH